jgi:hypothetical protein
MSYKTKAEATKAAKKVLKLMRGKGWKIQVWDNIDWHFHVGSGPVMVCMSDSPAEDKKKYWSMVNSDPDSFGPGLGMWTNGSIEHFADPNDAAKDAVLDMLVVMDKLDMVRRKALRAVGRAP